MNSRIAKKINKKFGKVARKIRKIYTRASKPEQANIRKLLNVQEEAK